MKTFNSKEDLILYLRTMDFEKELDMEFLSNNFLERFNPENKTIITPICKFNEKMKIYPDEQKEFNTNITETTIGSYIFNRFVVPTEYFKYYPYIDKTINSKVYAEYNSNLAFLLSQKLISPEVYAKSVDKCTWLGFNLTNFKGYSMDFESLKVPPELKKLKEELLKKYEGKITPETVSMIENQLIAKAKELKKDTGLFKIIDSGSKGDFGNNYKNLVVMRGMVNTPEGAKFIQSNLVDGNNFEEYITMANNSIAGSYGRAVKTAIGGYQTKLVVAGFSVLSITEQDCYSDKHLKVEITESNFKKYIYRNVKLNRNDKYEELKLENKNKFLNKVVLMRSPQYCHTKNGICEVCYGNLFKYNDIKEGLNVLISEVTSKIMNLSMKSFHDSTQRFKELNFIELLKK